MPETTATNTRAWMPASELPEPARLRLEHAGRWVAWAEDGKSVVAVGDDPESVRAAARQAGTARAVLEWVPPVPFRPVDPGA
ncbi:MAG: DUF5678 domain-containing protein [Isosphaeraceae bacterium]